MKILSICVALFGLLALGVAEEFHDLAGAGLGVTALLCAVATWRSVSISSFLKIFVSIFSIETIVFGVCVLVAEAEMWPASYADYKLPVTLPITVGIFSILVYLVAQTKVVRQLTKIADHYFNTNDVGEARIWPFPAYSWLERRIAVSMIVLLVLINQAQVGITLRLSFFNRDWFNAIQNKDAAAFWHLLLFVFMPWAIVYVASALVEFFMQNMLVIRWRHWLTDFFVARWLGGHNHYRMSLAGTQADNPDQRIQEDVNRFIDGGGDGSTGSTLGIYSYSIVLISTVSSLVSFSVLLWGLSTNFTIPGTELRVPGFLFWIALIYAAAGTFITHKIGRSLAGLYFERQHMEADYRFSLARLREYTEQIALLDGERVEEASLDRRFGGIIGNWLALINRRMKLLVFTASYGQLSGIIPFIFTAPFYFAGTIALGVMTQTAGAFGRVEGALNFFISYYNSLAGFKSVVDRLSSFDELDQECRSARHEGTEAGAGASGRQAGRVRRPPGQTSRRNADHRERRSRFPGRRERARHRAFRRGQIDTVPRHFRHLAVRRGQRPHPRRGRHHGGAAEALHPDRLAAHGNRLPGGSEQLFGRRYPQGPDRCAARQPHPVPRSRGGVVAASLRRRTAAHRAGARLAGAAGLALPR